jgi:dTMP kinase
MGIFTILEGVDGSGKSTQARLLTAELRHRGYTVATTCEPTHGPIGEQIRAILRHQQPDPGKRELAKLFALDREQHQDWIADALLHHDVVICDRYVGSSYAYQGGSICACGRPDCTELVEAGGIQFIRSLNRHCRPPDVALLLDLPAETAAQRMRDRGKAREATERDLDEVGWRYRRWARREGAHILDADRPEQAIAAEVLGIVLSRVEWVRAEMERTA